MIAVAHIVVTERRWLEFDDACARNHQLGCEVLQHNPMHPKALDRAG